MSKNSVITPGRIVLYSRKLTLDYFYDNSSNEDSYDVRTSYFRDYFKSSGSKLSTADFCKRQTTKLQKSSENISVVPAEYPVGNEKEKFILDGATIKYNGLDRTNMNIVYFLPNAGFYRMSISFLAKLANDFKCDVHCFDYRGIAFSSGDPTNYKMLVNDGCQIVNDLSKKSPDSKILLFGQSLGGAIATLVAHKCILSPQRQMDNVYLFADRTFSSVSSVARSFLETDITDSFLTRCFKTLHLIAKPLSQIVLKTSGWEIDVLKEFIRLPEDKKLAINVIQDQMIKPSASLAYNSRKCNPCCKSSYELFATPEFEDIDYIGDIDYHNSSIYDYTGKFFSDKEILNAKNILKIENPKDITINTCLSHFISNVVKPYEIKPRISRELNFINPTKNIGIRKEFAI